MPLTPESRAQQEKVFNHCLEIYEHRTAVRGELWAEFDVADALHNCKSKFARAEAAVDLGARGLIPTDMTTDEALDSLFDLINYAAFTIRHINGDLPNG